MSIYNVTQKKKTILMHKINFFNNLKWIIRCIKTFGYYMEAYGSLLVLYGSMVTMTTAPDEKR